ncbi:chemotaxis protein CheA [Salinibius halmophilus]|uniref:chemotaxis protein CheA n=1 Tax=Salinibius halmophilus TaxID=1853216 RepID=UPI000E661E21|nr:chemotaxis protein CheA [Salinibius halmophilus]
MSMEAALQTYFSEANELIDEMENDLLALEQDASDELLNSIFRAAHTIKGSAGIFGLDDIVEFTHVVENVLDKLRDHELNVSSALVSLLFRCRDHIQSLLQAEQEEAHQADHELGKSLLKELNAYLGATTEAPPSASIEEEVQASTSLASNAMQRYVQHLTEEDEARANVERMADQDVKNDLWHISLRFGINSFRDGMDPLSFISYLSKLGKIKQIRTLADHFPTLDNYDAESCYLGFEIRLDSQAAKQEIEDVFEFVQEDSDITIIPPHSTLSQYIELINSMPDVDLKIGEILLECGALTKRELAAALQQQAQHANTSSDNQQAVPIGDIITESSTQLSPVLEAAVRKQSQVRESIAREQKSLRVDADKLDLLINYVGELVTAGAGAALHAQALNDPGMLESIAAVNSLLEEVRDAALNLRMVAIGATFTRFQRVVRDVSKDLGKNVELSIMGAETELDKSVVEKIADPLMHLVRNAMDHGLETPEKRLAAGKSEHGELLLNAYHDSGNIVIEVCDDGAGIDVDKLRAKAVSKGLIAEEAVLEKHELLQLIFEPGLSTAQAVSNLSGRGVGMDVVRRNITELRGRIEVDSDLGKGTTVRIILPLTLAIIDGFLIGVADQSFVIPLDTVSECVELDINENHPEYIDLRGQVLPLVDLRTTFDLSGNLPKRQSVVVVQSGHQSAGIIVDRLMGELQTVIKPLGQIFGQSETLAGSTILGSGAVALILDVQGLIEHASKPVNKLATH